MAKDAEDWDPWRARQTWTKSRAIVFGLFALAIVSAFLGLNNILVSPTLVGGVRHFRELEPFYFLVNTHDDLCIGGRSHSGYVGLKGDSEDTPKRSFFWCVSALNRLRVILTRVLA